MNPPENAGPLHADLATVMAHQSIAQNLERAWEHASAAGRQAFADTVLAWAVHLLHQDTHGHLYSEVVRRLLTEDFQRLLTIEQRTELAVAMQQRILQVLHNPSHWDNRHLIEQALVAAAQRELGAAAREAAVHKLGGG